MDHRGEWLVGGEIICDVNEELVSGRLQRNYSTLYSIEEFRNKREKSRISGMSPRVTP